MKNLLHFLAASAVVCVSASFGQPPALAQGQAAQGTSGPRTSPGEAIYRERCAGCHEAANARVPRREALRLMPAARILRALDFGVMMNVAYPLRRDEREAVATFLGSGASDPTPAAAAYCADRTIRQKCSAR